jgi:hypothetical protein
MNKHVVSTERKFISEINGMVTIERNLYIFDDYYKAVDFFFKKEKEKNLVVSCFKAKLNWVD